MGKPKEAIFIGYSFNYDSELQQVIPEWWRKNSKRKRECLNTILSSLISIQHKSGEEGLFVIPTSSADEHGYHRTTWKEVRDGCGLFSTFCSDYSKVKKIAKLYTLTERGREFARLQDQASSVMEDPIVEILYGDELITKPVSKIPDRIWSRGVWDIDPIYCQFDPNVLESYLTCRMLLGDSEKTLASSFMFLKNIRRLNGKFIQLYKRIGSGRLYGMSNTNLQNLPRTVRSSLFAGYYDVDMVNAHYTLASQLYRKTIGFHSEYMSQYVQDRDSVRTMLAESVGRPVKDIKKSLLILLYGGSKKFNSHKDNPYATVLGELAAVEFLKHPFVQGLDEEISDLVEELKPELNRVLLQEKLRGKSLHSALAFKLQGIEAEILDLCIRIYEPKALYFDGFITQEEPDCDVLEKYVEANCDYWIKFEAELLQADCGVGD